MAIIHNLTEKDDTTTPYELMKPPYLLIATPIMRDPNFERAVVLIAEHTSGGAIGFVINKPTTISLRSILPQPNEQVPQELAAWSGGPVNPQTGIIIHDDFAVAGDTVLKGGIVISSMREALERLVYHESRRLQGDVPKQSHRFRFIVGYAGWGEGQLDEEIRRGAWEQVSAEPSLLFHTPWRQIWDSALGLLGTTSENLVVPAHQFLN